jgi:hypothetical protein
MKAGPAAPAQSGIHRMTPRRGRGAVLRYRRTPATRKRATHRINIADRAAEQTLRSPRKTAMIVVDMASASRSRGRSAGKFIAT